MNEETRLNLYQRLLAIENELQTVAKNFEIGTGKYAYKAVSEADIKRAVRPLEYKYGVKSFPVYSDELCNDPIMNGDRVNFHLRLKITYRFVNVDNPDEYIDIPCYGDGIDTGDKAPGKAQTYATKYALMMMYHMITGDDPDKEASKEYKGNATPEQVDRINALYLPDEIAGMLARIGKNSVADLTAKQAEKMIAYRETVAAKAETY